MRCMIHESANYTINDKVYKASYQYVVVSKRWDYTDVQHCIQYTGERGLHLKNWDIYGHPLTIMYLLLVFCSLHNFQSMPYLQYPILKYIYLEPCDCSGGQHKYSFILTKRWTLANYNLLPWGIFFLKLFQDSVLSELESNNKWDMCGTFTFYSGLDTSGQFGFTPLLLGFEW